MPADLGGPAGDSPGGSDEALPTHSGLGILPPGQRLPSCICGTPSLVPRNHFPGCPWRGGPGVYQTEHLRTWVQGRPPPPPVDWDGADDNTPANAHVVAYVAMVVAVLGLAFGIVGTAAGLAAIQLAQELAGR